MSEPVPIFIDLARLKQLDTGAYEWVLDSLGIEVDDDDLEQVSASLRADIFRFERKFALRDNSDVVSIYDLDSDEWTSSDDALVQLLKLYPFNPLRQHQLGYLDEVSQPPKFEYADIMI